MTAAVDLPLRDEPWYHCFGCSPRHPFGLRLDPRRTGDDGVTDTVTFSLDLCSYPGVVHGGIVTTAVDDTMANAILLEHGVLVFSSGLRVRFLAPVVADQPYVINARITEVWPGGYRVTSEVIAPSGDEVLVADGTFAPLRPDHLARMASIDDGIAAQLRCHMVLSESSGT
ncbi:PaaI family thioesterase [Streptomyces sp. NPDC001858]